MNTKKLVVSRETLRNLKSANVRKAQGAQGEGIFTETITTIFSQVVSCPLAAGKNGNR